MEDTTPHPIVFIVCSGSCQSFLYEIYECAGRIVRALPPSSVRVLLADEENLAGAITRHIQGAALVLAPYGEGPGGTS